MARVLITGGAGFIGSAIAQQCLRQGLQVRLFDLKAPSSLRASCETYIGSILDPYEIARVMEGCDYVIHAAAALGVGRTEANRLECLYINIQGTINVFEACVKKRVRKILFASSSEVYGDGDGQPFHEESPLNPKSNYAVTKLVGEEYARAYSQSYGLDYTIARFFSVYGEDQSEQFVIPKFVRRAQAGLPPQIFGDGRQLRCFCHVDDIAAGAVAALVSEKASGQIFNIGNPGEPITMRELADRIVLASGKKLTPEFVSFERSDRNSQREIYRRVPSIGKAAELLKYSPHVSLDEGLRRMFRASTSPAPAVVS